MAKTTLPKADGEHALGDGLVLVNVGASRRYMTYYRIKVLGETKRRKFWIGSADDVSERDARHWVSRVAKWLRDGLDPHEERKKETVVQNTKDAPLFADYAREQIADWSKTFKGGKGGDYAIRFRGSIENHAIPALGKIKINEIRRPDIIAMLKPLIATTPIMAEDVRARVARILESAIGEELREGPNPAAWDRSMEAKLGKRAERGTVKGSHDEMDYEELPDFMLLLQRETAVSARALEIAILTCVRTGELLSMRKSHVNWQTATWVIPNAIMKMDHGQDHDVPLCPRAMDILRAQCGYLDQVFGADTDYYVWAGQRLTEPLSDSAMLAFLHETMGRPETVHGFRATFRTWADDVLIPRGVDDNAIEMCLAHRSGGGRRKSSKAKRAYRRGTMFVARQPIMAEWTDYALSKTPAAQAKGHRLRVV